MVVSTKISFQFSNSEVSQFKKRTESICKSEHYDCEEKALAQGLCQALSLNSNTLTVDKANEVSLQYVINGISLFTSLGFAQDALFILKNK
jgi:hypothetical protein